jgi:hypothetical protein
VLNEAIQITGPLDLKPIMARALRLGDELHSRNTAATLLLEQALSQALRQLSKKSAWESAVDQTFAFFHENDYLFLRVGMAAAKATADAAHGVEYSSVVTGMAINCREFAIRVSGLGDTWLRGDFPELEGKFFDGYSAADAEWIGGESCVTETIGLGGFAQACAPSLMSYQGGSYKSMVENNTAMYQICVGEHPAFRIPTLDFRGSPLGIDIFKVVESGVTPLIDGGLAGKRGGQIGAGILRTQPDSFKAATDLYATRYAQ